MSVLVSISKSGYDKKPLPHTPARMRSTGQASTHCLPGPHGSGLSTSGAEAIVEFAPHMKAVLDDGSELALLQIMLDYHILKKKSSDRMGGSSV